MRLPERQQSFKEAAGRDPIVAGEWKRSELFGVSNSAKVVDGGLLLGVSNLDNLSSTASGAYFLCVIKFPPEDDVFFAVYVGTGLTDLRTRLAGLAEAGRNNNVRLYLRDDGRLYLRNDGFWDSLKVDDGFVPASNVPAVGVDRIIYAVHPPAATARRSLLAREFSGFLARFVGRGKVHEIFPFGQQGAITGSMRRAPGTIPLADIEAAVADQNWYDASNYVRRFHTALNHLALKHFVILTGLSGTGKSSLARAYAKAVHGIAVSAQTDPLFFNCPVRPDWTDPTGLTGYFDIITNRYIVPPFLQAVLLAITYPDAPVFVCLDEMNLARVEYYFSDVLSAMETGGGDAKLQLHSSATPLEGSTGGEILDVVPFPANLYVIGTINVDETTHPISDKVLDRAVLIDMSDVNLGDFLTGLGVRDTSLQESISDCRALLEAVETELLRHRQGFGYRVAEEFVRYYYFARSLPAPTSAVDIIDDLLMQKVLVKLRGTEKQRPMLEALRRELGPYPNAGIAIQNLLDELGDLQSFQFQR